MSLCSEYPSGSVVRHPDMGLGIVRDCALMLGDHVPRERLCVEFENGKCSDFFVDDACMLTVLRSADDMYLRYLRVR